MGLADVVALLLCPHCAEDMEYSGAAVRCRNGHAFDVARQGYVNLLPASASAGTADTRAMVDARDEFLRAGHYAPLAQAVAETVSRSVADARAVVDVGAGTGYYLATVLDAGVGAVGVALDLSKYAARRAAQAHPAIGAVVCDAWQPLPLRTGGADVVINVFAPRNGAQMHRILRPDGALVVVTPELDHLAEIVEPLGLLKVDEHKRDRVAASLEPFDLGSSRAVRFSFEPQPEEVRALVAMGPSAWHTDSDTLAQRLAAVQPGATVTASVNVEVYRPS